MFQKRRKREKIGHATPLESSRLVTRVATGIFAVVFGVCLVLYVITWIRYQQTQELFLIEGIEVHGKVVALVGDGGVGQRAISHPVIEFTDHNNTLHRFESMYATPFRVGDVVYVFYLLDSPQSAIVKDGGISVYNVLMFVIMLAMFFLALSLFLCALFYDGQAQRQRTHKRQPPSNSTLWWYIGLLAVMILAMLICIAHIKPDIPVPP
jgi:heme/copper-type cytochrome/quinol oxidase subunit 2